MRLYFTMLLIWTVKWTALVLHWVFFGVRLKSICFLCHLIMLCELFALFYVFILFNTF